MNRGTEASMRDQFTCLKTLSAVLILFASVFSVGLSAANSSKKWVVTDARQVISGIAPEVARSKAIDRARSHALESVVREMGSVKTLLQRERDGQASNFFSERISSRAYGRILDQEILVDSVENLFGPSGQKVLQYYVKLRVNIQVEQPTGTTPYGISLELNRERFREGDSLILKVFVKKDCYLHIYNITADNRVLFMYPLSRDDISPIKAGTVFTYPDDGRTLRVYTLPGDPENTEQIRVVATEEPLYFSPADVDTLLGQDGFLDLASTSLDALEMEIVNIPFHKRAEASIIYTVFSK